MPRGEKFTAEQIIGKLREAEVELARGKTAPSAHKPLIGSGTVSEVPLAGGAH
jgi:hypothetical protein